jgi:hypothetical protein
MKTAEVYYLVTEPQTRIGHRVQPVFPVFVSRKEHAAMTSRPASGRALCLAVAHCSHPDLDPTDKALLMYLAMNADYSTGRNARPGNPAMCGATTLKRSALNDRLEKNIHRRLIERTVVGDGRSNASTYRICVESSFYPDQSTTGEWLIEKPSGLSRTDSENKPSGLGRTDSDRTVRPIAENCPAEPKKLSGAEPETVRQLADDTNTTPETHQHHTNNAPDWLCGLFFEHNHRTLQLRATDRDQFMAAIKEHGEQTVKAAWLEFVRLGTYNADTRYPAYLFFKDGGADLYIQAEKSRLKAEQDRNDPKTVAAIEANIQRQMKEYNKFMTATPPPQNGGDVHEYFTELDRPK